jgi:cell wall-associated NlpC family hydrolase
MLPSAATWRVAALRARRRVLDQEAWMVGRSPSVAPLLLVLAAFAIASPASADPEPLLPFDPPAQPASLASATLATAAFSAAGAIEMMAPAGVAHEVSTTAAGGDAVSPSITSSDPSEAATGASVPPASSDSDAAADDSEIVDPTEAIGAPAAAEAPAPQPAPQTTTTADLRDQKPDSGELGVEYQLSVRDAASFLDRLSARFKRLVEQAMTYLGTPYRRGGTTRRGLDCSGLVGAVYGEQGLDLPRTAAQQFAEGVAVAATDLRPGDLVFFRNTYKRGISHVGIYIGDGRFLHAAGRRHGVIVSELSRPYYRIRYAGARRPATAAPEAATADRQGNVAGQGTADVAGNSNAAATLASAPRR